MQLLRWLALLIALFALNACVPVMVVGAAGAGKVYGGHTEDSKDLNADNTVSPEMAASNDIQVIKAEPQVNPPTNELPAQERIAQEIIPPKLSAPSDVQNDAAVKLIGQGWNVALNGGQNADGSLLYFDLDHYFYGFDGCRYFKGKYQADISGSFMINSLVVSSKGSNTCGNDITKNLFFVDSLNIEGAAITLLAQNNLVMTLTPQIPFDAKAFLNKAKFKNYRNRRR
jgi:hypothetical protein